MTRIHEIATTETDIDNVEYMVGERADGTDVKIPGSLLSSGGSSGTSFPGSPATGDIFWRSDRAIEYFYDGTQWLSTFTISLTIDSRGDQTASSFGQMIAGLPYSGTYGFYVESINVISVLTNATTGSNYFTFNFYHVTTTAGTLLGSYSSISDTQNAFQQNSISVGVALASSVKEIHMDMVETGAASGRANAQIIGRLVG